MKVTGLIPAYNEENTIGDIVKTLYRHQYINEILVINDGSSDRTSFIAGQAGARVINMDKNRGKGAALKRGIDEVENDIILMLDGDLIGLEEFHINNLLTPLLKNETDMTVGVFTTGRGITDLAQFVSPNLSGQRAVKTKMVKDIKNLEDAGYGVEVALNEHIKKRGNIKYVDLPDLSHIMKEEKRGFFKGVLARGKMYWDIVKIMLMKLKI